MSKWLKVKLDDICKFSKGEQLNKLDLEKTGKYQCINGGIEPSGYTDKWNTESNTITISEGGNSCGYINYLKVKFWSGGHCYSIFDIDDKTDKLFLYYALKGRESKIMSLRVGSGLPNIQQKSLKEFEFEKPESLIEQRKIAQILSITDAVIEKTQAAIAKYKAIKQGMLYDLFTRGIDVKTGKLRPKQEDASELYKESNLGWIPREWDVKIFGKEVDLIHGHQFRDYDFVETGLPVAKIGQVKPENLDLSNCSFVKLGREEEFKNEIICNGDVLMALTGATLGKACLVSGLSGIVLQNYRVGRFEPVVKENDIDKSFLYYLLIAGEFLQQIFSKVNSGAQGNVGKTDFEKATFKKPPFNEQKIIAERFNSIDKKLNKEQTYLQKLQQLKSGLMADLLSGKKLVSVPNEFETEINN